MTRRQVVYVLAALTLAAFVYAFVLINGVSHQTIQGSKTDPADPDALAETTAVRVECAAPASGPRLNDDGNKTDVGAMADADDVAEDDGYTLGERGIELADVSDVCGRLRTERVTHAGELSVLGLILGGTAALLRFGARRDPVASPPSA